MNAEKQCHSVAVYHLMLSLDADPHADSSFGTGLQYDNAVHAQENKPEDLPEILQGLETALQGKEYLAGDFSVADVAMGAFIGWATSERADKEVSCIAY